MDGPTVEDAIALAVGLHRGQRYPSPEAEPYVFRPLRVMLTFRDPVAQMAAVLHDAVEDTRLELHDLVVAGYPPAVVAAVDALTRRPGEPYDGYIERVAADPVGRRVKVADLVENLANNRSAPDAPGNADRIRRYEAALARLAVTGRANPAPHAGP